MVRAQAFHACNRGSIPLRCIDWALTQSEPQPALQRYVTLEVALKEILRDLR